VNEALHPTSARPGDRCALVISYTGSAATLDRQIVAALGLGADEIVVDLGDAEMMPASALAGLARVGKEVRARGGRLAVVCPRPTLERLLRLTLLDRVFAVYGSRDAALRQPT
jgi:anti-anti-sigma factor